jgi:hypothetical protein
MTISVRDENERNWARQPTAALYSIFSYPESAELSAPWSSG